MKRRIRITALTAGCLALLMAVCALAGCGSSEQAREDAYKAEWKTMMEAFYKKLDADDKKAQELSEKKDTVGVVKLVNERIRDIEDTIGEVLALEPTRDLYRLEVMTLAWMQAIIDQLKAANELNEANIAGKPTADLSTKVTELSNRMLSLNSEMTLEQIKEGISVPMEGDGEGKSTTPSGTTPQSTLPSTSPGE